MRTKILTFMLLLCLMGIKAQELTIPQLSQYLADNPFVLSPAYSGIGDHVKIRLNGLTQWVGIKDAPDTQSLAADMRVGERSGLGILLYNDSNGFTKQRGAKLSFAHHLTIDRYDDEFLSFGLSYNFNQFRIDTANRPDLINDPNFSGNRATSNHNFDVSILYRRDKFYISGSISNILGKDLTDFNATFEPNKLRNYFLYSGYRYKKNKNSNFEIEPSVFVQYFESDGRSSTDVNVKFRWYDFEDYFYAGLNYKLLNDKLVVDETSGQLQLAHYLAPLAGFKKNNFYFGYSYQFILNEIIGFSTGTHVLTVGFDLFQGVSNCRCTY